jgi:hypothetical protein
MAGFPVVLEADNVLGSKPTERTVPWLTGVQMSILLREHHRPEELILFHRVPFANHASLQSLEDKHPTNVLASA